MQYEAKKKRRKEKVRMSKDGKEGNGVREKKTQK